MDTVWRHLLGGALALMCGVVLLGCLIDGWSFTGPGGADESCRDRSFAVGAPHLTEATQYSGRLTVWPLGLHCTIDTRGDGQPPFRQSFVRWESTVAAAGAVILGVAGLALLVVTTPTELRRFMRAVDPASSSS